MKQKNTRERNHNFDALALLNQLNLWGILMSALDSFKEATIKSWTAAEEVFDSLELDLIACNISDILIYYRNNNF